MRRRSRSTTATRPPGRGSKSVAGDDRPAVFLEHVGDLRLPDAVQTVDHPVELVEDGVGGLAISQRDRGPRVSVSSTSSSRRRRWSAFDPRWGASRRTSGSRNLHGSFQRTPRCRSPSRRTTAAAGCTRRRGYAVETTGIEPAQRSRRPGISKVGNSRRNHQRRRWEVGGAASGAFAGDWRQKGGRDVTGGAVGQPTALAAQRGTDIPGDLYGPCRGATDGAKWTFSRGSDASMGASIRPAAVHPASTAHQSRTDPPCGGPPQLSDVGRDPR
jgi:hypothetical protein